jgi:hypothetical protein
LAAVLPLAAGLAEALAATLAAGLAEAPAAVLAGVLALAPGALGGAAAPPQALNVSTIPVTNPR